MDKKWYYSTQIEKMKDVMSKKDKVDKLDKDA